MPQEKSSTQPFWSLFIPCIIWWAGQTVGHELVQLFVTSFLFLSFQEPCQRRYSCQALSTASQWLLDQSSRFLETFLMGEGLIPNLMIAKTESRARKSFHKICERPQAHSGAKKGKKKIEFVSNSLKIIFLQISVTRPKTENQNPRCNLKIVISKMKKKIKSNIQNCQQHNVLEIQIKNHTSQIIEMSSVAPPNKLPTLLNTCNFLTDFLKGRLSSVATKYGNFCHVCTLKYRQFFPWKVFLCQFYVAKRSLQAFTNVQQSFWTWIWPPPPFWTMKTAIYVQERVPYTDFTQFRLFSFLDLCWQ